MVALHATAFQCDKDIAVKWHGNCDKENLVCMRMLD